MMQQWKIFYVQLADITRTFIAPCSPTGFSDKEAECVLLDADFFCVQQNPLKEKSEVVSSLYLQLLHCAREVDIFRGSFILTKNKNKTTILV